MFISKKRHLAIIKEMHYYWSKERDNLRSENKQLTAQLKAKASFKAAQETPLPGPVPAVERPKHEIVHLSSMTAFQTLCGESPMDLNIRRNSEVEHAIVITSPQQLKLTARQSWCADCLD